MKIKQTIALLTLSLTLSACSSSKTETVPDEMPDKTEGEVAAFDVVATYQAGVEKYNAKAMDPADFTDDVTLQSPMGPAEGKEAVLAAMEQWRVGFPDLKAKSARIFAFGDDVIAVEGVSNGTHTEAMGEIAATSKATGNAYLQIVWFKDSKISRIEAMSNPMTLMQQIGAAPAPEGAVPAVPAMPADAEIVKGEANSDNEAVVAAYYAAFNTGDGEALGALATPDFSIIHHGMNTTMTMAQAGEHMAMLGKGLTGMALTPEKVMSVGDYVLAKTAFTAKHTGELMGMAATNKEISTPVYQVFKIADGKISQVTEYVNIMHMAGQMQPAQQAAK